MKDKIDLLLVETDRAIKIASEELNNENLTNGEIGKLHVELRELKYAVKMLNKLKYEN
jgi:hypothetical protein